MGAERTIRTSVEMPEELHRRLHEVAARKGCSADDLILESLERAVAMEEAAPERPRRVPGRRLDLSEPIIPSRGGKPFDLTNEQIHELIEFP